MATYAIGDIQGCYTEFRQLLDRIAFDPAIDRLWLVGDLVNRGPHSLEVLRFVRSLGTAALTVLGNHDLHLLMLAAGCSKARADDTLENILNAPDRAELLDWLRHQRLLHVDGSFVLVHAGLLPQWTVPQAATLAAEVEAALRAGEEEYHAFLAHLWGSEPAAWHEDLQGWPRLRVIVNAMTRLRFCTPQGVMEFRSKGESAEAPPGHLPWFDAPGRKSADHTLVTGHWSALGLRMTSNLLALDTGCLWGRQLSAVRLEDRSLFQVPGWCRSVRRQ
ncbi:MAG: symmetrical bis(5'-nucleosyl)-tetraphosphatase [Sterolibacterium sp.]|jgi:bis(5'-nucleosyl)-tetraphosphatase (symmetrical)|nr:symmetrical bis(5'-nucleosyl)-tetraphosphatase [Sterolibacterium sp.]MBP9800587.1 symmetrical bis(5'-nucleosyl)-tetraphosphatase [Sterolibacterium sp.]